MSDWGTHSGAVAEAKRLVEQVAVAREWLPTTSALAAGLLDQSSANTTTGHGFTVELLQRWTEQGPNVAAQDAVGWVKLGDTWVSAVEAASSAADAKTLSSPWTIVRDALLRTAEDVGELPEKVATDPKVIAAGLLLLLVLLRR